MERSTSGERFAFLGDELHIVHGSLPFGHEGCVSRTELREHIDHQRAVMNSNRFGSENELWFGQQNSTTEFVNIRQRLFNGYSTTSSKQI